jgi:cytoskeletal protein CcmA (bactofilin family)
MKPAEGSTVLGRSVVINGDIVGSEDLYIDGKVKGTITLTESRLTLGPNAEVAADLQVHDAVILGRLQGNIIATGRVELRQAGALLGNVTAARLSIEESASMRGKVSLTGNGKE